MLHFSRHALCSSLQSHENVTYAKLKAWEVSEIYRHVIPKWLSNPTHRTLNKFGQQSSVIMHLDAVQDTWSWNLHPITPSAGATQWLSNPAHRTLNKLGKQSSVNMSLDAVQDSLSWNLHPITPSAGATQCLKQAISQSLFDCTGACTCISVLLFFRLETSALHSAQAKQPYIYIYIL